jgi:hypothetical protein
MAYYYPEVGNTMPVDAYDIFGAKDRVIRILRETGSQPYSRLLMNAQLPEDLLAKVLELLQREHKVKVQEESLSAEPTYQPASGAWALSGSKK